jgi:hypothetical protein
MFGPSGDPLILDEDHPMVSTFVQLRPSTDWFTGFTYKLYPDPSIIFQTLPFDAGLTLDYEFLEEICTFPANQTAGNGIVRVLDDPSIPGYDLFRNGNMTYPIAEWECHTHDFESLPLNSKSSSTNQFSITPLAIIVATTVTVILSVLAQ